jgi:hypothetical protein
MTQFKIDLTLNRVSSLTNKRDFSEIASACDNISQLHHDKFGIGNPKIISKLSDAKSSTTYTSDSNGTMSDIVDQVLSGKRFYGENFSTASNTVCENSSEPSALAIEDSGNIVDFNYFTREVVIASSKKIKRNSIPSNSKRNSILSKKNAGLKNKKWDSEDKIRFYKGLELFG